VQDQVNTTNLTEFDYLYNTTRNQALAANPQVQVDAELSTNYGTADQMATAAQSVNADGYYINATTPTIGQADQFLQEMQAGGY
jgi:outer membrane protein assembly factor BamE (lipoprotein component of BamABCDE complex)